MPSPNPANVYYEAKIEFDPWVIPEVALEEQLDELTEILLCEEGQPNEYEVCIWIDTPLYPGEHGEFDWRAAGYARPMLNKIDGLNNIKELSAKYHISMGDMIPDDVIVQTVVDERKRKIEQREL